MMSTRNICERLLRGSLTLALGVVCLSTTACDTEEFEEHYTFNQPVERVDVHTEGADVVLSSTPGGPSRVQLSLRYMDEEPEVEVYLESGSLIVRTHCPDSWHDTCGGEVELHVPGLAPATVSSVEGSLTFTERGGDLRARTEEGEILVFEASGRLDLQTEEGEIRGQDLGCDRMQARSDEGDIELHFNDAPDRVEAHSIEGTVRIEVPRGRYDISAMSQEGAANVSDLADVPGSARYLEASSVESSVWVQGI